MDLRERKLPPESGFFLYDPRYKGKTTPKFVVANMAIDFKRFIEWAQDYLIDGKLYVDVLVLNNGAPYAVLNEWRFKNAGKFRPAANRNFDIKEKIAESEKKYNLPE